jgi:hypothetical protein
MSRKLTSTVNEAVYSGLHRTIGQPRIGQFVERLAGANADPRDMEAAYREMAADKAREREAL